MSTNIYQSLFQDYTRQFNRLKTKSNSIGVARLALVIALLILAYFYITTLQFGFALSALIFIVVFIFLVKWNSRINIEKNRAKALMDINQDELNFLEKDELNFEDGFEFVNPGHAYSFDLDFFGKRSFYQVLNRTKTYVGKTILAKTLLNIKSQKEIQRTQLAVEELTKNIAFRQEIAALGVNSGDSELAFVNLMAWTKMENSKLPKFFVVASYALPAVLIGLTIYNFSVGAGIGNYCVLLFLLNIGIVSRQLKTIKRELVDSSKIDKILKSYALILQSIEKEKFAAETLKELQFKLTANGKSASEQIKILSGLFEQLDSISNPFGAALFNGFLMFHLHTLRGFQKWKSSHAKNVVDWLLVIGEMEALNSLANFAFNNKEFVYPELNTDQKISFEELGHPLLSRNKRVASSVSFEEQQFIILTGSNMSGKSTFLRSLGVNMILAGIGAPVCAKKANIHPLPVYVSMRVSDSLNDNESFFFAEVKRLKEVMDAADKTASFVLLDEILRGTNSDDKRTGTVEVVKKIISKNAIGALATHDLKVCDTTAEFPNQLSNKCFEVEIVNNDLYFDYKLREGVCKNKSATFLMKKMEVI